MASVTAGPFYTFDQLEQLWLNAGGNAQAAPTAAAIAMAESSGGQGSYNNDNDGSTDYGVWQINTVHENDPGLPAWSLVVANPVYNAQAAVSIFNAAGQSFSPWSTYTSGAYEQYLPAGSLDWKTQSTSTNTTPTAGAGTPSPSTLTQTGTFNVQQSSGNALQLLKNWITSPTTNSLYLAFFSVGVLVILASIKETEKAAPWVAGAILLILMLQAQNNASLPLAYTQPVTGNTETGLTITNYATATYQ